MGKSKISNYFHTGGYNRLAGGSNAPGSMRPREYFWRWKIIYMLICGIFVLIGFFYMLF